MISRSRGTSQHSRINIICESTEDTSVTPPARYLPFERSTANTKVYSDAFKYVSAIICILLPPLIAQKARSDGLDEDVIRATKIGAWIMLCALGGWVVYSFYKAPYVDKSNDLAESSGRIPQVLLLITAIAFSSNWVKTGHAVGSATMVAVIIVILLQIAMILWESPIVKKRLRNEFGYISFSDRRTRTTVTTMASRTWAPSG